MSRRVVLSTLLGLCLVLASCSVLPTRPAGNQLRIMVPNAA